MPICGICKHEKPRSKGSLFHALNECMHTRLFICRECLENVAVQRSYHEFCYECEEHIPMQELTDLTKDPTESARWFALGTAIMNFEKSHGDLFQKLPATTDPDCVHPGSLHEGVKKWREKFMP